MKRNKLNLIFLIVVLSLTFFQNCNPNGGAPTANQNNNNTGIVCDIIPTASGQITPIQSKSWSLQSGNLSQLVVNVNPSEVSKFQTNDTSCGITEEISIISTTSNSSFLFFDTSMVEILPFIINWQPINNLSTFTFDNLNLAPKTKYMACVRATTSNGNSSPAHCNDLIYVPEYISPNVVKCNPATIKENTYSTGSPQVDIFCLNAGSYYSIPNSTSFAYADSSNNMLTSWLTTYYSVSMSSFVGGKNMQILTKSTNPDGYYSVGSVSFYLPLKISLKLNYKSKSAFSSTIYNCNVSVQTFDNQITQFTSMYPNCTLTNSSQTDYLIDCTSIQTCPDSNLPTPVCTYLPRLNTDYGFCSNFWDLPSPMSKNTDYF